MEKFGCLGLLVILLGLLVVWGTILNIPNAGEWIVFNIDLGFALIVNDFLGVFRDSNSQLFG